MTNTNAKRTRNFATVVYPESAPKDWLEKLSSQFIPSFVSPLHNLDLNPTGEEKKPHFHVILMYDNVKTIEQAQEVFSLIGGVGCEKVNSLRGYCRYMCHLDNPEKHQYLVEDVTSFCGADYTSCIGLPTDKYKAIREMISWCEENNQSSFSELLIYASEQKFDWFRVLCDNGTIVIKEYLKSRSWTQKMADRPYPRFDTPVPDDGGPVPFPDNNVQQPDDIVFDNETGELIE